VKRKQSSVSAVDSIDQPGDGVFASNVLTHGDSDDFEDNGTTEGSTRLVVASRNSESVGDLEQSLLNNE